MFLFDILFQHGILTPTYIINIYSVFRNSFFELSKDETFMMQPRMLAEGQGENEKDMTFFLVSLINCRR